MSLRYLRRQAKRRRRGLLVRRRRLSHRRLALSPAGLIPAPRQAAMGPKDLCDRGGGRDSSLLAFGWMRGHVVVLTKTSGPLS